MANGVVEIEVILNDGNVTKDLNDLVIKGFDMLKSSIKGAFNQIDTIEQFKRVLTTITGDTDAVNISIKRMSDIIDGTSFSMDVMANSVEGFVNRSVDIGKATDYTEAWGNAVAFYGDGSREQFENVTDALHNMVGKGTVGMDELNRVTEAGIPAVALYADAVGKTEEEVSEALLKGEISAEQFVDVVSTAMMEGSESFPKISNAMEEQGSTWKSVFSTMVSEVSKGISKMIEEIDRLLVENGLPTMREILGEFNNKISEVFTAIVDKIEPAVEKFKEVYNVLEPWIPLILAIVGAILGMKVTYDIFGKMEDGIGKIESAVEIVKESFSSLKGILNTNPWLIVVGAAIAAVILIITHWETIKEFFINLWEGIKEITFKIWEPIQEKWNEVVEFFTTLWEGIGEFFSGIWDEIIEVAMIIWEPLQEIWKKVVEFFQENWIGLVEFFSELWENVKEVALMVWEPVQELWLNLIEVFKNIWNGIKDFFVELWENIKDITVNIWEGIKESLSNTWENIKELLTNAWDAMKENISNIMDIISNVIETQWNVIKIVIDTVINIIKTIIDTTWNVIKGIIETVMNLIKGDIDGAWNSIKGIIKTIMEGIRSIIDSVWNAIESIIATVVNGIKNTVSSIFNTLKGIASDAFEGVKNAVETGINGALNVITKITGKFRDAGRNIVTSIADGITGAIGKVTDAISGVVGKVRGFLPFSPAKEGPLKDINNLDFGGPIGDSLDGAIPKIQGKLNNLLTIPDLSTAGGYVGYSNVGDSHYGDLDNRTVITGNSFYIREESDIEKVAEEFKKLEDKQKRGKGRR